MDVAKRMGVDNCCLVDSRFGQKVGQHDVELAPSKIGSLESTLVFVYFSISSFEIILVFRFYLFAQSHYENSTEPDQHLD